MKIFLFSKNFSKKFLLRLSIIIGLFFIADPVSAAKITKDKTRDKTRVITEIDLIAPPELKNKVSDAHKKMQEALQDYNLTEQITYWQNNGKDTLYNLLESEGYYDSEIDIEFAAKNNNIIFHILTNDRYTIAKISLTYAENSNREIALPALEKMKVKAGDYAIAQNILLEQQDIANYIEANNCLINFTVDHNAFLDRENHSVEIIFLVKAGDKAGIKSLSFTGLSSVNPDYVRKILPLKEGDCFKQTALNDAKLALQKSGLFAVTTPLYPASSDEEDMIPLVFDLKERKHRTFKLGINYSTILGLGVTGGWGHRNFFGNGEQVDSNLSLNKKEKLLDLSYSKPFFMQDNQTLKLNISLKNNNLKAYSDKEGSVFAGIERKISRIINGGAGIKVSVMRVETTDNIGKFTLFSMPLFLKFDTRNNTLDPQQGHLAGLDLIPFFPFKKRQQNFLKEILSVTSYLSFLPEKVNTVLAVRVAVGSIGGKKIATIPATEKYYLGGSNSIRGYAPQLAGAVDQDNHPVGGQSFIETQSELRVKINEDIGIAAFLDTGNSFNKVIPKIRNKFFSGVGIGFRYYTNFGPLRVDIAFPTNRRKQIDKPYQLYFTIGHSF